MASHDPPMSVNAFEDPMLAAMLDRRYPYASEEVDEANEMETSLMFKLIKEKLAQLNSPRGNKAEALDTAHYHYSNHMGLPAQVPYDGSDRSDFRDRIYSEMTAVTDDDFYSMFAEYGEHPPGYEHVFVPQLPEYAWHCQFCPEGVGWTEHDPCTHCGRYFSDQPVSYYNSNSDNGWICQLCSNLNWDWRTQCNRCHTCRQDVAESTQAGNSSPPSVSVSPRSRVGHIVKHRLKKRLSTHPAGVFKDHDWVCTSCGNINWDWRVQCHQCQSDKPVPKRYDE